MQWRNSISIICSEQSFSFTDIPLLYSLMHFQTSISLFIINLGMFCLTLSYIPPFSIKALSGEMLSSCLPKTPPPHPFPIKHSCWCSSSCAVQLHGQLPSNPLLDQQQSSVTQQWPEEAQAVDSLPGKQENSTTNPHPTAPWEGHAGTRGATEAAARWLFASHPQVKVSPDTQMPEPVDI